MIISCRTFLPLLTLVCIEQPVIASHISLESKPPKKHKTNKQAETPKQVIAHTLLTISVLGLPVIPQRLSTKAHSEIEKCGDLDTQIGLLKCIEWIKEYYPEVRATAIITQEALASKRGIRLIPKSGLQNAKAVVATFSMANTHKLAAAIAKIDGSFSDEVFRDLELMAQRIVAEREMAWSQ